MIGDVLLGHFGRRSFSMLLALPMGGCPIHSGDDTAADRSGDAASTVRWDLVFLALAVGMLALVLGVGLQLP
jgi:hypothetical protein